MIRMLLAALGSAILIVACGGSADQEASSGSKKVVYTTFYPTTYFTERIAGDLVDVVCPVPEDEDPIFWQPDDETLLGYQAADLVVLNGAKYEKWALTASLSPERVLKTTEPFQDDLITFENAIEHSHGPAGPHSHVGIDGHTWMDPVNAKAQAREIYLRLVELLPGREDELRAGFESLAKDLAALHEELTRMSEPYRGEAIYSSHPAYNYLAKRYGWNIENLHLDPGEMPDDATVAEIRRSLAAKPARFILWESAPLPEIAVRFETELSLRSIEFSPCEITPNADLEAGEDYLTVMQGNLRRIAVALKPDGG